MTAETALVPMTDAALLERYLALLDVGSAQSKATYARALRPFMRYLARHGIAYPARADVLRYRDSLSDKSPATVQSYMSAVRSFFAFTAREGIYPNVAEGVRGARLSRLSAAKDYLTPAQVGRMLDGIGRGDAEGRRDYAVCLLAVSTGLRTAEIASADICDLRAAGASCVLWVRSKGMSDKSAFVKLPGETETALRAYLAARGPLSADAPLFACLSNRNRDGRLSTRSVSRIIKGRLCAAGLNSPRITAHSLRHSAGMLALMGGEPLERVRQLLRHSDISTTMIYLNHLSGLDNTCAETIMRLIRQDEHMGGQET